MPLLTQQEAATRLGVTTRTLQKWTKSGRLASKKVGRVRYYDEDDLEPLCNTESAQAVAQAVDTIKREHQKAPAIIRKHGRQHDPPEPMMHVKGRDLIPNHGTTDFPDTLDAYLCEDDPTHVEVRIFDKVRRVFASSKLVFPGNAGGYQALVEYERVGGRYEAGRGGKVYIRYVRVDPRRRIVDGVALGQVGGNPVVLPSGGYKV